MLCKKCNVKVYKNKCQNCGAVFYKEELAKVNPITKEIEKEEEENA